VLAGLVRLGRIARSLLDHAFYPSNIKVD